MSKASANYCNYTLRTIAFTLAAGGVVCSWIGSSTCKFISFQDNRDVLSDQILEPPPFDNAIAANVGIFRYEITEVAADAQTGTTSCVAYNERWFQQDDYPSLASAQFCALFGPIVAVVGIILNFTDVCVCNFPGSFLVPSFVLLLAAGIQAGTFTLVADPVFCFEDDELDCSHEKGIYWSATAVALFFVSSCLLCCSPRSDPFCHDFGWERSTSRTKPDSDKEEAP